MAENKFLGGLKGDKEPFFGLGRQLNFYDWPTRIALLATCGSVLVALGWNAMHGMKPEDSVEFSLYMGLIFFFTWLLAEELDPDHHLGGIIGGGISIVMCLTLGIGNPLALLWLVFILRMLSRTSGDRHRVGDNILLIGASYFFCKENLWLFPALTGVAYALESQLKDGYFRSLYLAGISFAVVAFATPTLTTPTLNGIYFYLMLITLILVMPAFSLAGYTKARGERDRRPLNPRRLQSAIGIYILFNFILCWYHGNVAALSMAPTWAAGMGVGLYIFALAVHSMLFKKKEGTK